MTWAPRRARESEIPALEELIRLSARALQTPFYSQTQIDAALGPVFGVDRQLISDGTYFAVEGGRRIIGCGGWSRRGALFGSDRGRVGVEPLLDPARDAARIRAFFVDPDWARQGIGSSLLATCEAALQAEGFWRASLVATLAGEPLYAKFGYAATERYEIPLRAAPALPVVRMEKRWRG